MANGRALIDSLTPGKMVKYCRQKQGGRRALYRVEIWEKAWENFEQFTVTKIRDFFVGMHI
ncbi:hypothetical protein ANCDUO_19117 [Ancylostoma duodenale]|uniref:Uncharacterized protein n=1 Tax=Ancylostoma duodenale TaxID=51022 RepID=A0A0C2G195_9BILA|nr:hypothetical protein ANCDUO_19117 [Ancylostoma duodenale]